MVPQTLGALGSFLALVAPGIVFELLRERKRAGLKESAFRESARVALGSLVFTAAACLLVLGVLGVLALCGVRVLDVPRLVTDPAYPKTVFWQAVAVAAALPVTACALAVLLDHVLGRRGREVVVVRQQTAWHEAFRTDRPDDSVPWVHVRLTDGSSFYGYLRSHTASGAPDEREIALEGAALTHVPPDGPPRTIGDRWSRVVIPSSQITYLRLQYRSRTTDALVPPRRHGSGQAEDPASTGDTGSSTGSPDHAPQVCAPHHTS
ncbi:DUF6338 family protein [Saccharothrix obliqua]|uniref:DUF6338 family protein n=1 Tax=Saccharothrix obliqua TaxID=2861747 RepID=UPI001C5DCC9D|nr:DUF6338 family protein [Saccharothrix obliqua]MBW4720570.1 hypothetical protein [Saccharothrix obliqua]